MKCHALQVICALFVAFPCSSQAAAGTSPQDWPIVKHYDQQHLAQIALPLGGIGTGTVSLGGRGDLRDWEIVNRPAIGFNPANAFFAIRVKLPHGQVATRALTGPIEEFRYNGAFGVKDATNPGLPCFRSCTFDGSYPAGFVHLEDPDMPVAVTIQGFNPFIPTDPDASGIPIAVLRYTVRNKSDDTLQTTLCGSLENFIGNDGTTFGAAKNKNDYRQRGGLRGIYMSTGGIDTSVEQWGTFALTTPDDGDVSYRTSWLPRNWGTSLLDFWDDLTDDGMLSTPASEDSPPTASLAVRASIPPHGTRTYTFFLTWDFPNRFAWSPSALGNYYSTRYKDAWDVAERTLPDLDRLETETVTFVRAFCGSALHDEVKEAALFNLSTLRTQTCFRTKDGRFFAWEGCGDKAGCCEGSCTHVWNYEQAVAFLFGSLARTMREVEFGAQTDDIGLMSFRAALPLGQGTSGKAAADGQMGCIMKMYRDWQLSGDEKFLRSLYPNVKRALQFAWIKGGWDANMDGVMEGCQHNTMDVEYYGPNPQMGLWYLGALRAGEKMAWHLGDSAFARTCHALLVNGSIWIDSVLFNGRYYIQKVMPAGDRENVLPGLVIGAGAKDFTHPDYQLGDGCLVDQLVGQYMAHVCNLGYLVHPDNVRTTLQSIMKYNYKSSLADHFNCMRTFALGNEAALLMASYPDGRPANPFPYFTEVMTGFEYTAAIGMLYEGLLDDGLKCIGSIRERYDGLKRNPYDEAECGHHYGRAMISWAGLLALSGFHYSAVDRSLQLGAGDGPMFWSNGYAYGTFREAGSAEGRMVSITAIRGELPLKSLVVRGHGRVRFDEMKTIRAGETVTFTVPANDVMAGAPSLDLTTNERLLLVKPPRVSTGKNVFQREVYFKDKTTVSIEGQTPGAVIHYTLNGSEPTSNSPVYEEPIPIARSATVRTLAIKNGRQSVVSQPVRFERLSAIRDVTISPDPAPEYAGHGPLTLVDGKRGAPNAPGNDWLGFEEKDVEVLVDLGEARTINLITAGFLSDQRRWIFHPTAVEYAAGTARDNMRTIYAKNFTTEKLELAAVKDITAKVKPIRARYVRVRAKNVGVCPPWHPGAGGKAWLFMDEIAVK
jgi:non-lysosomal glucosylceramidase